MVGKSPKLEKTMWEKEKASTADTSKQGLFGTLDRKAFKNIVRKKKKFLTDLPAFITFGALFFYKKKKEEEIARSTYFLLFATMFSTVQKKNESR